MTDLFTHNPTTAAQPILNHEDRNQRPRGGGVQGAAPPTGRVLDFPDIDRRERPDPSRIDYRPGEASCESRDFASAYVQDILEAACADLDLDPAQLTAARRDGRSGWLLALRVNPATGAVTTRQVALVQGVSAYWLLIGLRQILLARGAEGDSARAFHLWGVMQDMATPPRAPAAPDPGIADPDNPAPDESVGTD